MHIFVVKVLIEALLLFKGYEKERYYSSDIYSALQPKQVKTKKGDERNAWQSQADKAKKEESLLLKGKCQRKDQHYLHRS